MCICPTQIFTEFDTKSGKNELIYASKHGFYRADFHETHYRSWSYCEQNIFFKMKLANTQKH